MSAQSEPQLGSDHDLSESESEEDDIGTSNLNGDGDEDEYDHSSTSDKRRLAGNGDGNPPKRRRIDTNVVLPFFSSFPVLIFAAFSSHIECHATNATAILLESQNIMKVVRIIDKVQRALYIFWPLFSSGWTMTYCGTRIRPFVQSQFMKDV